MDAAALREAGDVVDDVARALADGAVMMRVVGGAVMTDALKLDGAFDAVEVVEWESAGVATRAGAAVDGLETADDEPALVGAVASMGTMLEASTGSFAQWGCIVAMPSRWYW